MLTNDLLDVKVVGRVLEPKLLSLRSQLQLERAERLLTLLHAHQEKTLGEVNASIQAITALEVKHKIWKGLAKILIDDSTFEPPILSSNPELSPAELREQVFVLSATMGLATQRADFGRQSKDMILSTIAESLNETVDDILEFLYADHKDMHRLIQLPKVTTPIDILHRYNLVLCQSLLLYAKSIHIVLDRPTPKWLEMLFRRIKFYRLLFRVWKRDDKVEILIDGPQSLLSQSSRYGLQFAMFLPVLPLFEGKWSIDAKLLWGKKKKTEKSMRLSHGTGLKSHYKLKGLWKSNTEEWFEQRYFEKDRDWVLTDGEVLYLGEQQVLIPNYKLTSVSTKNVAYLNIVGFWRKKQVLSLIDSSPYNVIFAISKRYAGATESLPKRVLDRVILFAEVIPIKNVMDALLKIKY